MGERYIRDLPDDVKRKVAGLLDTYNPPNWRSLINVIRHYIPSCNDAYIARVRMETLLPEGSPTYKLLNDLEKRGTTVGELVNWISSMGTDAPGIQTVLNVLSEFY